MLGKKSLLIIVFIHFFVGFFLGFKALGSDNTDFPTTSCQMVSYLMHGNQMNVLETHQVNIDGINYPVEVPFNRTNRDVSEMLPSYLLALTPEIYFEHLETDYRSGKKLPLIPAKEFTQWLLRAKNKLKGKKILDVATGDGQFVEDLRKLGADAIGIDVHLTDAQMKEKYFHQRDMAHIGYEDNYFDLVFSNAGPFHYAPFYSSPEVFDQILGRVLKEKWRVTKPGGLILLGPVGEVRLLEEFVGTHLGVELDIALLPSGFKERDGFATVELGEDWPRREEGHFQAVVVLRKKEQLGKKSAWKTADWESTKSISENLQR